MQEIANNFGEKTNKIEKNYFSVFVFHFRNDWFYLLKFLYAFLSPLTLYALPSYFRLKKVELLLLYASLSLFYFATVQCVRWTLSIHSTINKIFINPFFKYQQNEDFEAYLARLDSIFKNFHLIIFRCDCLFSFT